MGGLGVGGVGVVEKRWGGDGGDEEDEPEAEEDEDVGEWPAGMGGGVVGDGFHGS